MSDPVITGGALLTAAGEAAGPLPWEDVPGARGLRAARGGTSVRDLWPDAPARLGRLDRASAHALFVAHRALGAAGFAAAGRDGLAVIVGTALGCAEVNEAYHRGLVRDGAAGASPMLFARTIPSAPAGEIALAFAARGHTTTVMAGRCSGIAALAEARRAILLGRCASALVVAGDVFGPDRLALWSLPGGPEGGAWDGNGPAEAMVAVMLERPDVPAGRGRAAVAVLERASVCADEGGVAPAPDWLGAAGLVELVTWLGATSPRFDAEVRCPRGFRGRLRAVRAPAAGLDTGRPAA